MTSLQQGLDHPEIGFSFKCVEIVVPEIRVLFCQQLVFLLGGSAVAAAADDQLSYLPSPFRRQNAIGTLPQLLSVAEKSDSSSVCYGTKALNSTSELIRQLAIFQRNAVTGWLPGPVEVT